MIAPEQYQTLLIEQKDFALSVMLNRPQAKNAMNNQMIAELTQLFTALRDERHIRAIILSGADGVFCAGGDIKEMREHPMPAADSAHNLDQMLQAVNQASQVVIAKIEGVALGGGLGLVCVSDIAIASDEAKFGLPEVRLGIAPAFISPYILQRVGLTRARELMLTGRRFSGKLAQEYGLVHEACSPDQLTHFVDVELDEIRHCAPHAIAAIKRLIFDVYGKTPDDTLDYRAELLNCLRASDEGQEGLSAFIEKRAPNWN